MGHFYDYLAFRMSSERAPFPSLAAKTAKACEGEGGAGHVAHRDELGHDAELEFRT